MGLWPPVRILLNVALDDTIPPHNCPNCRKRSWQRLLSPRFYLCDNCKLEIIYASKLENGLTYYLMSFKEYLPMPTKEGEFKKIRKRFIRRFGSERLTCYIDTLNLPSLTVQEQIQQNLIVKMPDWLWSKDWLWEQIVNQNLIVWLCDCVSLPNWF